MTARVLGVDDAEANAKLLKARLAADDFEVRKGLAAARKLSTSAPESAQQGSRPRRFGALSGTAGAESHELLPAKRGLRALRGD